MLRVNAMLFTIPGEPIAKARPRFSRGGFTYDPQCKVMKGISHEFQRQMDENGLYLLSDGPLRVEVSAYSHPPRSWSYRKINAVLDEWQSSNFIANKYDADNIVKLYLDCMTKIVYTDDRQVASLLVEKRYSLEPRVEILVATLEDLLS